MNDAPVYQEWNFFFGTYQLRVYQICMSFLFWSLLPLLRGEVTFKILIRTTKRIAKSQYEMQCKNKHEIQKMNGTIIY